MQYIYPIEIPANTTESNPTRVNCILVPGELSKVFVYFPWGCAGLVHVRIIHYESQLYPTNTESWFEGNDILIEFPCSYNITEGKNEFKVEGHNEDDFHAHTPVVSFVVLPTGGPFVTIPVWVEG